MKKITLLGVIMLLSLFSFTAKAQIYYDLTTAVGGSITLGYNDVNTEQAKPIDTRWITTVGLASATSGLCSVTTTFKVVTSNSIEFWLSKCDAMVVNANIGTGRGLSVTIDGGTAIPLNGTNSCNVYNVPINKEVPCKIKVVGIETKGSYVSLFTFSYAAKAPTISAFKINGTAAVIDQTAKNINLQMPFGTDISAITPVVTLGGTATSFTPQGVQDFSKGPVVFTITDGATPINYTVNITVKSTPDTDKSITSMSINGKTATINEATGAISCEFPSFTGALGNWPVVFTLSGTTCTSNVTSGSNTDFLANNTLTITVTAQDGTKKIYNVTPKISTKKNIGILTLNGQAETYDNLLASAFSNYYVTYLAAATTAPSDIVAFYSNYDLIVLHANVGGTNATGVATKAMVGVKPILNLKAFFYNTGRWAWSTANPLNSAAGLGSADVAVSLQSHPIFSKVTFSGTTLNYYDNLPATNVNGTQFASDLATLTGFTSHTLATSDGTIGIQAHEIQDNVSAKYLLIGLSMEGNNYSYFNANTINILNNAAAYLLNPNLKYDYTTFTTDLKDLNKKSSVYYSNGFIYNPNQQSVVVFNAAGVKVKYSIDKTINTELMPKGVYMVQTDATNVFKFIK